MPDPKKTFKRLIVDSTTGKYLAPGGKWTTDEGEALDFNNVADAIIACGKNQVQNAEILLRFGHAGKYDVRLPLRNKLHRGSKEPTKAANTLRLSE